MTSVLRSSDAVKQTVLYDAVLVVYLTRISNAVMSSCWRVRPTKASTDEKIALSASLAVSLGRVDSEAKSRGSPNSACLSAFGRETGRLRKKM